MKKRVMLGLIMIVCILLIVIIITLKFRENKETQTNISQIIKTSQQHRLGTLCTGEQECIDFCVNNRGRCELYCHGTTNELCLNIFPPESDAEAPVVQKKETCVSNPSPVFTSPFIDITKISEISRYGNNAFVNPGSQARSYVSVKEGENTPIYSPVNATITKIYFSNKNYTQFFKKEYIRPEYRIDIVVSCEVFIAFDHVVSLAEKLKASAPQTPAPGKNDGVVVSIPVQAGELLGYTSGSFPGRAFDFIILNRAQNASHMNPARWDADHSHYMDCPYNYFPNELKQQYLALIKEENGVHSCGPRIQEISNTPAGYWFQGNSTEISGPRLAIYGSKHFVEWTLIRDTEKPIAFRDNSGGFTKPEMLTEGKSACYFDKDKNTHLFLKMLPDDRLALVADAGSCPSTFPEQYEVWER